MKKLSLFFILLFIVGSVLVSCGDTPCTHTDANNDRLCDLCGESLAPPHTEHTDADANGKCDECGEAVPLPDLVLIEDKIASFKFVVASGVSSGARQKLNGYIATLKNSDVIVKAVDDKEDNVSEYEVLIGDVLTRGEKYQIDKHTLGNEGYAVKRIGNKVIITAGSSDSLLYAIDAFFNDILNVYEDEEEVPENVTYTEDIIEIQDNYSITSVKVDGTDIRDYKIGVNSQNSDHRTAAKTLQEVLYTYTGYYLPIVSVDEAGERAIILVSSERDGSAGFNVKSNGKGTLYISSAYDSKLLLAIDDFLLHEIKIGEGDINFDSDYFYEYYSSIITYEEYGAKGDGKSDDTKAIRNAHNAANSGGQKVVAKEGATYYIKNCYTTIPVRGDVDWKNAKFTIDDNFSGVTINAIFEIAPSYEQISISSTDEISSIFGGTAVNKDTITKLNWSKYGYSALVIPTNNNKRQYIRFGENSGSMLQSELIRVDENGNISEYTPFLFDYETVTSLTIIRIDETPLTITGGIFTTIAKQNNSNYFSRGIAVHRSNVTLKNIQHYVTGDTNKSAPYSGFIKTENVDHIRIEDCVFTARKKTSAGTYDIMFNNSNDVLLLRCTQTNFTLDDGSYSMDNNAYWGIAGSNGCKNLYYDSCTLSRYDAHIGVYNGGVINSKINVFELTGGGNFLIENTEIHLIKGRNNIVELRRDYGGLWDGTITIRNCSVVTLNNSTATAVITAPWNNHNFGYTCYMPNLIIDGIKYDRELTKIVPFSTDRPNDTTNLDTLLDGTANKNPRVAPRFVKILNDEGYYYAKPGAILYRNTVFEGFKEASE